MRTRWLLVALVVAVAVLAAACTGTDDSDATGSEVTTTTFEFPELEFGNGVLPRSVPSSWPTPEQAVIGTTMIDGSRRLTEFVITYPADVSDVAAYYTTNLPVLGYEITNASGGDGDFTFDFSGDGVTGEVVLVTAGTGLTAGTIRILHL